jgi:poly(3-hydroxybutyrate) depolymerase
MPGLLAALCLLALTTARLEGSQKFDPRRLPALFRYIDEEDDVRAGAQLEKLLKKYNKPSKCKSLAKTLRRGRPYLAGLSKNETVKVKCADGLERDFTVLVPSKYNPRSKTGLLVFLHGGISQPAPGCGAQSARNSGSAVRGLNFIVIGPSTYGRHEWGEPALRRLIRRALFHAKQRFNVDENRVFIGGSSDGGRGTFAMMETEATFFAAAVTASSRSTRSGSRSKP